MRFTQYPSQHAPLGQELRFAFSDSAAHDVYIRISDFSDETTLGTKRFLATASADFDAAPYLRRALRIVPSSGGTGFKSASGRTVSTTVEARIGRPDGPVTTSSPVRTFMPCREPTTAPALLSTLPRTRLIGPDQCDELTLLVPGPGTVTITAQGSDSTTGESFQMPQVNLHVFRLDMRQYPETHTLTVDTGPCGKVVYTVVGTPRGAKRLAWRSEAGAIKHYTFPIELSRQVDVSKSRAYGPDGPITTAVEAQQNTILRSAYEIPEVLDALAGILSAPQVWLAEGDRYTPVDVLTDTAVTHRYGEMGCLEIAIRANRKNRMPWN